MPLQRMQISFKRFQQRVGKFRGLTCVLYMLEHRPLQGDVHLSLGYMSIHLDKVSLRLSIINRCAMPRRGKVAGGDRIELIRERA